MTFEQAIQLYRRALGQMELGDLAGVSAVAEQLRAIESNDPKFEVLRRLLVTRLSYKQTKTFDQLESFLNFPLIKNSFIDAEILFVRALQCFHLQNFSDGAKSFAQAAELYFEINWSDKAILSLFNELMGELNSAEVPVSVEEARLTYLERLAHHHQSDKMLGLILRHKALFLEKLSKFQGAEKVLLEALPLLQKFSTLSDYQLGVLQHCYLLVQNNKVAEAKQNFESLLGPFDSRLEFPRAFVQALVLGETIPSPDRFATVPPVWRDRASGSTRQAPEAMLVWLVDRGILQTGSGDVSVKRDSVEGQLLQILAKGRRRRDELCSLLWPDQADSALVVDRFSKVVARLRAKAPQLIKFEKNAYFLGSSLSIK